jgi:hypothetical protein
VSGEFSTVEVVFGQTDRVDLLDTARDLSRALEPFVGCVYFAPDTHDAYAALGFSGSSGTIGGVAMPDGVAYFTSRGSLLGQVHGNLVASAFAVFNPAAVVPAVAAGWQRTDAATIRRARHDATTTFLRRTLTQADMLDDTEVTEVADALSDAVDACDVAGRPLFAGVTSEAAPIDPLERAWFCGDALRECRGDAHNAAWLAEGLSAVEIGLLTELYWGLPSKSYVRTRAWSEEDLDQGIERMTTRGFIHAGALTDTGRTFREHIETRTDAQLSDAVRAMGDRATHVIGRLHQWSTQVRHDHGYPSSGPQDLANAAKR